MVMAGAKEAVTVVVMVVVRAVAMEAVTVVAMEAATAEAKAEEKEVVTVAAMGAAGKGVASTRPQSHWLLARVAAERASRAAEPAVEAWVAAWAVAAGPRAVAARAAAGAPRWHKCKGMRLKVACGDQRQLGVHSNHELSRAGCTGDPCSIGIHLLPPWHRDCARRHRPSRLATKLEVAAE
mgnify:CR=1 FL=1